MVIQFNEDKSNQRYADLMRKEEEDLVQLLSGKYAVEYANLNGVPINTDALRLIDEVAARDAKVAAYALLGKKVRVAARNPEDPKIGPLLDNLKTKGYTPELVIVSSASLEKAWKAYKDLSFAYESKAGSLEISSTEIADIATKATSLTAIVAILENTLSGNKSYRVSRILETLLAGALAIDASDVHLEPEESYIRLRYRLDGVLHDVVRLDSDTYNLLLSRIKLISGMKLNIKKDSQDGRYSIKLPNVGDVEVRVSVLPGAYNESVVMRVLNPKAIRVPMENLGLPQKLYDVLTTEMKRPDGMILTTGPTGSGKTTMLYALLNKVHTSDIKIITIEDPIEYHLEGIVQTQVNEKGYTFAEGLRAAVRQDPDIIMIGEIRDGDTASIAINSALTGHLVFSTLHTNDAGGTFPRLIDLGVNSSTIPSALRVSMAQRLVRKLCTYCRKESPVDERDKREIDRTLSEIEDKSQIPTDISRMWLPVGCDKCNGTGYKSRIGIYEAILMTPEIEKAVQTGGSDREIWAAAKGQGILTMRQDGILKVLAGVTSLEELERVIAISD